MSKNIEKETILTQRECKMMQNLLKKELINHITYMDRGYPTLVAMDSTDFDYQKFLEDFVNKMDLINKLAEINTIEIYLTCEGEEG